MRLYRIAPEWYSGAIGAIVWYFSEYLQAIKIAPRYHSVQDMNHVGSRSPTYDIVHRAVW